ncbi:hypothetical protein ONA91_13090 [Micromonospora sp. DR5-3]|uniref:hypothetical protein n=1 Tax=unclassified Micromonospora TaxID=2617518 RepID=UPI0011D48C86|nr:MULTISPECIES: hypothetical protein [unclassified Micromonospora]MCW3815391.1 hypothetical protein [Micromonospora sp. DR5-3]TYC22845.1 hypothetical protein FXF52_18810 [Micromonospora sp. MP36]
MPAASTTLRVLAASVIASLSVTGCQTLDDAGVALGRADLVNDLTARMDRALEQTWAADYQLPGGRVASIAQTVKPLRSSYTWPDGKITVTQQAVTRCATTGGRTSCEVSPPVLTAGKPSVIVYADARQHGLVTPPAVIRLLTDAALDQAATIEQTDTTLAGRHATCVDVTRAGEHFTACVTNEGVLGSFTGTLDGKPAEITLTRYTDAVEAASFDVPAGASVVDRRRPETS